MDGLAPPANAEDERQTGCGRAEIKAARVGETARRMTRATRDSESAEHTPVPVTPRNAGLRAPGRRDGDRDGVAARTDDESRLAPVCPRGLPRRHDLRQVRRWNRDGAEHQTVAIPRTTVADVGKPGDVDAFAARYNST